MPASNHLSSNHAVSTPTFNLVSSTTAGSISTSLRDAETVHLHLLDAQDPDTLRHGLDARFALLNTSMQLAF
ncbi:hypothetical protein F5888DRAFT_1809734 [Russula emetica]|nr:hypothetical protein F5888DRAFT_1809734 [Russula emetica]